MACCFLQEVAMQAATEKPMMLADTQWNALGTRLSAMGAQLKV